MKKTTLFSLLALSTYAFADGEMVATDTMMDSQPDHKVAEKKMQPPMVSLMSARPESNHGWYLFADVLYWHASVGSSEWAVEYPAANLEPQPMIAPVSVQSLNFKWSWAFKVGIGKNLNHDMWDTSFYYTRFEAHNSDSSSVSTDLDQPTNPPGVDGFVLDNLGNTTSFSSGSINWDIKYSMLDWELGRWCYASKNLALRPHVGIKGGWINQDIKEYLKNVNVHTVATPTNRTLKDQFRNNFWGVGPSAGINTLWILGNAGSVLQHRFSLFGDVAGALMYGHFSIKHQEDIYNHPTTFGINTKGLNRNLAVTMLQGALGFSWDTAFNKDRNHFMMKVGYEFQYWFRQNQLVLFRQHESGINRLGDDMALQGITAEFRFDF